MARAARESRLEHPEQLMFHLFEDKFQPCRWRTLALVGHCYIADGTTTAKEVGGGGREAVNPSLLCPPTRHFRLGQPRQSDASP